MSKLMRYVLYDGNKIRYIDKNIPIGDSYREKLNDYINQKFLGK